MGGGSSHTDTELKLLRPRDTFGVSRDARLLVQGITVNNIKGGPLFHDQVGPFRRPLPHAVFTLDHRLYPLILANARALYDCQFQSVQRALLELAADPEDGLGVKFALVTVLHTWGQAMLVHPHIHVVIPARGFRVDDEKWVTIGGIWAPVRV